MAIDKLKRDNIYTISVLFDERLTGFYKKFGFFIMRGGQIIKFQYNPMWSIIREGDKNSGRKQPNNPIPFLIPVNMIWVGSNYHIFMP